MYKHTYNTQPSEGQRFNIPSNTIQGQTLSIAEMLQRIQNGIPVTIHSMEYGEDEYPQPQIKDLTDIDELSYEVSTLQEKLDLSRKAYAKAEAKKELLAEQKEQQTKETEDEA